MADLKKFIAKHYSKFISPPKQIVVIGSIGKTTTLTCIKAILQNKFKVISTDQDGEVSITSVILKVRPSTQKIVYEIPSDIRNLDSLKEFIKPQTIVITKIDNLDEVEKFVKDAPAEPSVILNWEDDLASKLVKVINTPVIYYGFDADNCHVWAGNIQVNNFQMTFELNYGVERVEVKSRLLGKDQILSMLAAASVGINSDLPLIAIKKSLELIEPLPRRLQPFMGHSNSIILDDSFNNTLISFDQALSVLNQIPARRRILVLGEVKVTENSENLHRQIARKIYSEKIDLVLLGTGDAKFIADELLSLGFLAERMETNLQIPSFASRLLKILAKGDVVLIKGAKSSRYNEIVKKIAKKA